MFSVLRSGANSGLQVDSERLANHHSQRHACKNCHAKKLRCTREMNGCCRCLASNTRCEYEGVRSKRRRNRTLQSQDANTIAFDDASHLHWGDSEANVLSEATSQLLDLQPDSALIRSPGAITTSSNIGDSFFDYIGADIGAPTHESNTFYTRPSSLHSLRCSPSSEPQPDIASCNCLISAVSLLESISIHHIQADLFSVPQIIRHNKAALIQCRLLQSCPSCSPNSAFAMLLILLCQKLVSSYHRTVVILGEQYNKLHRPDNDRVIHISDIEVSRAVAREVDCSLIREYEVEIEEEPCVYGGLVQMQIKKINAFLVTLKGMVNDRAWSSHDMVLDMVRGDLKDLASVCTCRP